MKNTISFRAAVLTAGFLGITAPAYAIDIYPGDYTVLPQGINLALVYGGFTRSTDFELDGAGRVPHSSLNEEVGIYRMLHYSQIEGMPVAYQFYLPVVQLNGLQVGGGDPRVNNGLGDMTFGATAFFVDHQIPKYGTTVGLTAYVSAPTGKYKVGYVGAGAGTVTFTPQLGIIQGLGDHLLLDIALDVATEPSHHEDGYYVSVDPTTEFQSYLRYQLSPASSLSFGYAGSFGGKQYLDHQYTGEKSSFSQLRVFATYFVAPTWQLAGTASKAVATTGGFKEDYSLQLRLTKVF